MQVTLGQELTRSLKGFEDALHRWTAEGRQRLLQRFGQIGQRWRSEAVKRVPVETSRLKQEILSNAYEDGKEIIVECGTNVTSDSGAPYPIFLEFGTRYIAGGAVAQIGNSPFVTDDQAVHWWPAKGATQTGQTSAARKGGQLLGAFGGALKSQRAQEQMPWLRPAFSVLRDWATKKLDESFEPPKQ